MRRDLAPGADIVAAVDGGAEASLVLVVEPGRSPLSLAQLSAAVGPLAVENAPARRINVVVVGDGADRAAVDAAAEFLDTAAATTGQIVSVSRA